jgi:hypothetical protein
MGRESTKPRGKANSNGKSKPHGKDLLVEEKTQSTKSTNSTPLLVEVSTTVTSNTSPAPASASSISVTTDSVSRASNSNASNTTSNATSNATGNATTNPNDNSPTQRTSAFSDNPFGGDNPFASTNFGDDSDRLDHIANIPINSGSGRLGASEGRSLALSGDQDLADALRLQNLEALVRSTGPSSSRFSESSPRLLRFGPSLSARGSSLSGLPADSGNLSARFDGANTDSSSGLNKLDLVDNQNLLDNHNDQTTTNARTNAMTNATTKSATTNATTKSATTKSATTKSATTNASLAEKPAEKSKLEEILALEEEIRKTDLYEKNLEKDIKKIQDEEHELEETLVDHVMHGPHGGVMG